MAKQPVKIPIVPVRTTLKRGWGEAQLQKALIGFALLVVALVVGLLGLTLAGAPPMATE